MRNMEEKSMECLIRSWELKDVADLTVALNNKKIQDNLRDGLTYPYTENDAKDFITSMLQADKQTTYAFAITIDDKMFFILEITCYHKVA